jgi:hypothetical protein
MKESRAGAYLKLNHFSLLLLLKMEEQILQDIFLVVVDLQGILKFLSNLTVLFILLSKQLNLIINWRTTLL